MKTIKIKKQVTTVQEEEIELQVPYYAKHKGTFYKVTSEHECDKITMLDSDYACIMLNSYFNSDGISGTQITEDEYNEQLQKAISLAQASIIQPQFKTHLSNDGC
jgi:hypothetical protein